MRRFIDAASAERCTAVVTLKDKSTADCGRKRTTGTPCTQHARMAPIRETITPMVRQSVCVGHGEYQIVELCKVEQAGKPVEYSVQVIGDGASTMRWMHRTLIGANLNFGKCVQHLTDAPAESR